MSTLFRTGITSHNIVMRKKKEHRSGLIWTQRWTNLINGYTSLVSEHVCTVGDWEQPVSSSELVGSEATRRRNTHIIFWKSHTHWTRRESVHLSSHNKGCQHQESAPLPRLAILTLESRPEKRSQRCHSKEKPMAVCWTLGTNYPNRVLVPRYPIQIQQIHNKGDWIQHIPQLFYFTSSGFGFPKLRH